MTRGLTLKVVGIVIAVLACLSGINVMLGQATNQIRVGLIGHMEISGESLVSVQHHPNPQDPSRLGVVNLEISTIAGEKSINQVMISVDQGNNWIECLKAEEQLWTCDDFSEEGILIREFQEFYIVVN